MKLIIICILLSGPAHPSYAGPLSKLTSRNDSVPYFANKPTAISTCTFDNKTANSSLGGSPRTLPYFDDCKMVEDQFSDQSGVYQWDAWPTAGEDYYVLGSYQSCEFAVKRAVNKTGCIEIGNQDIHNIIHRWIGPDYATFNGQMNCSQDGGWGDMVPMDWTIRYHKQ